MNIGTHFSGQPMYGQLIDLLRRRYSIRDVAKLSGKSVNSYFVSLSTGEPVK